MTPEEKGDELVNTFLKMEYGILQEYLPATNEIVATKCAIIAVEEIIKSFKFVDKFKDIKDIKISRIEPHEATGHAFWERVSFYDFTVKDYWNEVLNYLKSKL